MVLPLDYKGEETKNMKNNQTHKKLEVCECEEKCLCDQVMTCIGDRHIKMRPRLYFVAGSILTAIGFLLAVFLSILFFSLSFLHLRAHQPFSYLVFGRSGVPAFWMTFPWLLLIIALASLAAGLVILKHYEFTHKRHLGLIITCCLGTVLIVGFVADELGINENQPFLCRHNQLSNQEFTNDSWLVGRVVRVDEHNIILAAPSGQQIKVFWDKALLAPSGSQFVVGQGVQIVGQWRDDSFYAQGLVPNNYSFHSCR